MNNYYLKAKGILTAMEKFDIRTFWTYVTFGAAKEVSKRLQVKDISLQEAPSAVTLASGFYKRQRTDEAFDVIRFYES